MADEQPPVAEPKTTRRPTRAQSKQHQPASVHYQPPGGGGGGAPLGIRRCADPRDFVSRTSSSRRSTRRRLEVRDALEQAGESEDDIEHIMEQLEGRSDEEVMLALQRFQNVFQQEAAARERASGAQALAAADDAMRGRQRQMLRHHHHGSRRPFSQCSGTASRRRAQGPVMVQPVHRCVPLPLTPPPADEDDLYAPPPADYIPAAPTTPRSQRAQMVRTDNKPKEKKGKKGGTKKRRSRRKRRTRKRRTRKRRSKRRRRTR